MNHISTENLVIRTAQHQDLPALNKVHEQVVKYFSFDPAHVSVTPEQCLNEGDLPPGGVKENYEMLAICDNDEVIGNIDVYRGFPAEDIAYISLLFLDENKRKHGYGRQVVNAVCNHLMNSGFSEARVAVSLRNWPGLKFWQRCGFDTITRVAGDSSFSPEGYASMELKRTLG